MLVAKFCLEFNYIGPKKNLGWLQSFLKDKKNHKFLIFINNNCIFFPSQGGPVTTLNSM